MINVEINKELLNELNIATAKILQSKRLSGTDLIKSVDWQYKNDMFVLIANDYFEYVSTGRRPRARKVPVEDLIKWMKKKGIAPRAGQSYNQVAFAIADAIYKNGIKAKNYINPVIDVTTTLASEELAEQLSEDIATEIAKDLTITI